MKLLTKTCQYVTDLFMLMNQLSYPKLNQIKNPASAYLPSGWCHESIWRQSASAGEISHFCAADKLKIGRSRRIEELHGMARFVISSHAERNDLQGGQVGSH